MTSNDINAIAGYVGIGAAILLAISVFAHLVMLGVLYSRLRREHPDHYKEIGEPSLFLNNSISKGFSIRRYLLDKDYLSLQDARVTQLGNRIRQSILVATTSFGVFFLACVVIWVTY